MDGAPRALPLVPLRVDAAWVSFGRWPPTLDGGRVAFATLAAVVALALLALHVVDRVSRGYAALPEPE